MARQVVLTGRDQERLDHSVAAAAATATGPGPVGQMLDLADLGSVRDAAAQLTEPNPVIDVLINNAGVMAHPSPGQTRMASSFRSGPTTWGTSR